MACRVPHGGEKNGNGIIEAVIFQEDTTDDQAKLFELAENFHRTELTPEERTEHMLKYAALLKKTGRVQTARSKQAKSQAVTKGKAASASVNPGDASPSLPTVTQQVAKDLGVTRQSVDKRTKRAVELAAKQGVVVSGPATMEAMDGETLDKVSKAAAKQAEVEKSTSKLKKPKTQPAAEKKIVDPVEKKIAAMWRACSGKTVTLGLFRNFVSDAIEIPGSVSIVKAALAKFEG